MKLESGCVRQAPKWTRTRTLKRGASYRPIESEDIKYVWAAYKKGALKEIGFPDDLTPETFKQTFERFVVENCHAAWTLFGKNNRGYPSGIVLAGWAPGGTYLIGIGAAWMPWASKRNVVECMIAFLDGVRRELQMVFYALPEHKRIYEVAAMHAVVRRVGTSYIAIPGKHSAVFETRTP